MRVRPVFSAGFLFALVCTTLAAPAHSGPNAVHWPAAGREREASDPIASVRWTSARQWTAPAHSSPLLMTTLRALDESVPARTDAPPAWHARRAVILRAMDRLDDARREIDTAIAQDRTVLDDPDVALTQGYLLARAGQFEPAVAIARVALARLGPTAAHRGELAVEIARWSMARGPAGLPDALALLREVSALGAPEPVVRATLSLALYRAGQADEAREVARGGAVPLPHAVETLTPQGALTPGEPEAAVGIALLFTQRGHDAVDLLARAAPLVQPAWRAGINELLAQARRAPATETGDPRVRAR